MEARRVAKHHKVILPALCWSRGRADFYAVTADVSSDGIRLRSSTVPQVGEVLTCSIRHIGQVQGRVVRAGDREFVMRVLARRHVTVSVARTLIFLAQQQ
ncbi:PilZ domain-containing protein [Methylobacterium nigriterrae]|uniref:PilZ domain-containing protein n=1 Tax=Methylobacterium nigriterrae TaxID=3127512 RepID=UPI0030140CB6